MTNRATQAGFEIRFVWWSLHIAFWGGFALGAHVVSTIGFNFPLGPTFYSYIQLHGHVQLVGWAGLFIIAISLHFIPRLASIPLAKPQAPAWVLVLIVSGLIIRFLGQSFSPYLVEHWLFTPFNAAIALSGLLVWAGSLLYVKIILGTIRQVADIQKRPALKSVRAFFLMMLLGWFLYPTLNFLLLIQQAVAGHLSIDQNWNEFAVALFINFVLIPVTFAFSIRLLPLYLRLPAIDWSVNRIALLYFVAVLLEASAKLPWLAANQFSLSVMNFGQIMRGILITSFIWKLDILTRSRDPWTVHRISHPGPERKPTRPGLPDYGEFGRFEIHIYAAYAWLAIAAILEMINGITFLADIPSSISTDALRHIYLLGFITNLIMGVAPRMMPGLIKKKSLARPGLVTVTFYLTNIAAISRVLPLITPDAIVSYLPVLQPVLGATLGLSGIWGLAAVLCLMVNLKKTATMA